MAGQTGSFEHCNHMETPLGLGFCEATAGDFSASLSRNREAWHSFSADLQEKRTKFGHPIFSPLSAYFCRWFSLSFIWGGGGRKKKESLDSTSDLETLESINLRKQQFLLIRTSKLKVAFQLEWDLSKLFKELYSVFGKCSLDSILLEFQPISHLL